MERSRSLPAAGVTQSLARDRAGRVADLRYALSFTIPRDRTERIAGHATITFSLGGEAAALSSASDRAQEVKSFAESMESLTGCTPEALTSEALAHQTEWNFVTYANALTSRPLLLITSDDGTAPDSQALAAAVRKAEAQPG